MVKFRFSVTNGYYEKGSLVELAESTAKLFESLNWGVIEVVKPKRNKKK